MHIHTFQRFDGYSDAERRLLSESGTPGETPHVEPKEELHEREIHGERGKEVEESVKAHVVEAEADAEDFRTHVHETMEKEWGETVAPREDDDDAYHAAYEHMSAARPEKPSLLPEDGFEGNLDAMRSSSLHTREMQKYAEADDEWAVLPMTGIHSHAAESDAYIYKRSHYVDPTSREDTPCLLAFAPPGDCQMLDLNSGTWKAGPLVEPWFKQEFQDAKGNHEAIQASLSGDERMQYQQNYDVENKILKNPTITEEDISSFDWEDYLEGGPNATVGQSFGYLLKFLRKLGIAPASGSMEPTRDVPAEKGRVEQVRAEENAEPEYRADVSNAFDHFAEDLPEGVGVSMNGKDGMREITAMRGDEKLLHLVFDEKTGVVQELGYSLFAMPSRYFEGKKMTTDRLYGLMRAALASDSGNEARKILKNT